MRGRCALCGCSETESNPVGWCSVMEEWVCERCCEGCYEASYPHGCPVDGLDFEKENGGD